MLQQHGFVGNNERLRRKSSGRDEEDAVLQEHEYDSVNERDKKSVNHVMLSAFAEN